MSPFYDMWKARRRGRGKEEEEEEQRRRRRGRGEEEEKEERMPNMTRTPHVSLRFGCLNIGGAKRACIPSDDFPYIY